jgi:uncharacterized membrane protein
MSEMMYVLAAAYDDVDAALADYRDLEVAHEHLGTPQDFDASVVVREPEGKVEIIERHDEREREGTGGGLAWGLAAGAVVALFPAVGILSALAVGGGAGALIGHLTHRASSGISRDDLKALGEVLDQGQAGLVVVYGPDMADRVGDAVSRSIAKVHRSTDISLDEIAAGLRQKTST